MDIISQMKTYSCVINSLINLNEEICLEIDPMPIISISPGQYLLVFSEGQEQLLPVVLFPFASTLDGTIFCGEFPKTWLPGTVLSIKGPKGNGFHIPAFSRHIVLFSPKKTGMNKLIGMIERALERNAEVTVVTDQRLTGLAPQVEMLPASSFEEILPWADYIAINSEISQLKTIRETIQKIKSKPPVIEVLLNKPMVCAGDAECGLCAVQTVNGWKHACTDGPVFLLDQISEDEG